MNRKLVLIILVFFVFCACPGYCETYEWTHPVPEVPSAAAISITKHPGDITAMLGEQVTFCIAASGNSLHYQWQTRLTHNESWINTDLNGANTDTLTFVANNASFHGRQYRCVISDADGNKRTSAEAELVLITFAIIEQPKDVLSMLYASTSFTVTAIGEGLTYQWQTKLTPDKQWTNTGLNGNKTATLSFNPDIPSYDGRQYRCIVTNVYGEKMYSEAATLNVNILEILNQPEDISVLKGNTATFSVQAKGTDLKYQWQTKINPNSSWVNTGLSGAKTNSLSFIVPDSEANYNGRQYRCVIKDSIGCSVTSIAATLTSKTPLSIVSQPDNLIVSKGKEAAFHVVAKGDGLTYQWQTKNTPTAQWANTGLNGAKTNTLLFTVPNSKTNYNGRLYRCIITDTYGSNMISNEVKLTTVSPMSITKQPDDATVIKGSIATFTVDMSGDGLVYQWQTKNTPSSGWVNTGLSGNKTNTLCFTVPKSTADYNGRLYRCLISDATGNKLISDEAKLTVPVISVIEQPKNIITSPDEEVTLSIEATGEGLIWQWQTKLSENSNWVKTGIAGNNTSCLTIRPTLAYDGRMYRCVVKDQYGNSIVSTAALLTVNGGSKGLSYRDNGDGTCSVSSYNGSEQSIIIPEKHNGLRVTSIANGAFYNGGSNYLFTYIYIPDTVTTIGSNAFAYNKQLHTMRIHDNISSIGNRAFYECNASLIANIDSETAKSLGRIDHPFCTPNKDLFLQYHFDEDDDPALHLVTSRKTIENTTIPYGVTEIDDMAFSSCDQLVSVIIPDSVIKIGRNAFNGCSNLYEVILPQNLEYISSYTFRGCSNLTNIQLPYGLKAIYSEAFSGCSNLCSISIPESITKIDNSAFENCVSIQNFNLPDGISYISKSAFRGCNAKLYTNLYSETSKSLVKAEYVFRLLSSSVDLSYTFNNDNIVSVNAVSADKSVGTCIIPDGVTKIGWRAFSDHKQLSKVLLPNSLLIIDGYAFYGCSGLTELYLPDGLISIGSCAFEYCTGLADITIPQSIDRINSNAFYNCNNLEHVAILSETTVFENNIFPYTATIYCYSFTDAETVFTDLGYKVLCMDLIDKVRYITMEEDFLLPLGSSKEITVHVFPDDNSTIIWHSSDTSIASVQDGIVIAHKPGTVIISATVGNTTESVEIQIYQPVTSISLSNSEIWLAATDSANISVSSYEPLDATPVISWSSSDTSLAVVDENGHITTFKPGEVTITASSELGISSSCLLHLCYPVINISFEADNNAIEVGSTKQLTAIVTTRKETLTNQLITLSSSNPSVVSVNESGVITGVNPGTATITATASNGVTSNITITVYAN